MSTRQFPHAGVHVHLTHAHDVTQVLLALPMGCVFTPFATEAAPWLPVFFAISFGQNAIWLLIFPIRPLILSEPRWDCDWWRTIDSFHHGKTTSETVTHSTDPH
jgi:hypothetical protein